MKQNTPAEKSMRPLRHLMQTVSSAKKNTLQTAGLFLLTALLPCLMIGFGLRLPDAAMTAAEKKNRLPIYSVETSKPKAALTFDAAWEGKEIPRLLNILAEHRVRATFFIVGSYARKNPRQVRAIAAAGHEIANHSDCHPHPVNLSSAALIQDADGCNRQLTDLGVRPTRFYRAPYGEYDSRTVSALEGAGYLPIQWSIDSLDWKDKPPEWITDRLVSRTGPGDILLLHTGKENTLIALPDILTGLERKGITLCPVGELLLPVPWETDSAGRQHPAA